jgi:hypothetical protein
MEKTSWTEHVRNETVQGVKENNNIKNAIKRRLTGLVTSCIGTAF